MVVLMRALVYMFPWLSSRWVGLLYLLKHWYSKLELFEHKSFGWYRVL